MVPTGTNFDLSSVEVKANFVPPCLGRRACPKGLGTRGAVHHAAVPTVRFSALWAGRAQSVSSSPQVGRSLSIAKG